MEIKPLEGKKRNMNFNYQEEKFLIELIEKYQDVIENKKTNCISNTRKIACWTDIERQFNNKFRRTFRPFRTLKKKYENMKKATKLRLADEEFKRTIELSDVDHKVKAIIDRQLERQQMQIDSDSFELELPEQPHIKQEQIDEDEQSLTLSPSPLLSAQDEFKPSDGKQQESRHDEIREESVQHPTHEDPLDGQPACNWCKSDESWQDRINDLIEIKLENEELKRKQLIEKHEMEMKLLRLEKEVLELKKHNLLLKKQ